MKKKQSVQFLAPFLHLDNVIIEFIRKYFMYHPEYEWNDDDTKTKIKIVKNFNKLGNDSSFFPRIVVRRGGATLSNPTATSNYGGRGTIAEFSQQRRKIYKAGAPYFLQIYTKAPGEAQNLAEELMIQFLLYKDRIIEKFNVSIEEHIETTPEEITTDQTPDYTSSKITITLLASFTYEVDFNIEPRYGKLQGVDMIADLDKVVDRRNEIEFETLTFTSKVKPEI